MWPPSGRNEGQEGGNIRREAIAPCTVIAALKLSFADSVILREKLSPGTGVRGALLVSTATVEIFWKPGGRTVSLNGCICPYVPTTLP